MGFRPRTGTACHQGTRLTAAGSCASSVASVPWEWYDKERTQVNNDLRDTPKNLLQY